MGEITRGLKTHIKTTRPALVPGFDVFVFGVGRLQPYRNFILGVKTLIWDPVVCSPMSFEIKAEAKKTSFEFDMGLGNLPISQGFRPLATGLGTSCPSEMVATKHFSCVRVRRFFCSGAAGFS